MGANGCSDAEMNMTNDESDQARAREGLRMGLSAVVTYLNVLLPYADAEAQRRMQEAAQLLREIPGVRDETSI